jgi:hypothetical protein
MEAEAPNKPSGMFRPMKEYISVKPDDLKLYWPQGSRDRQYYNLNYLCSLL